jgi:hypothetical protein
MITVIDLDDDITGEASITVEPASAGGTPTVSAETVTVITPETATKITADVVLVSGKTRKNSKVQFTLNGQDAGTAVTDDAGVFTKSLSNITQKSNILSVGLIDATNTVLAKSSDISFEKVIATSNFYNLVMSPSNSVEVSTSVTLTVEAEPNMSSVTLGLDGAVLETKVGSNPKSYSIQTIAPAKAGSYPISVNLIDSLGKIDTKPNVAMLTVTEKPVAVVIPPAFKDLKANVIGPKVMFTFMVENLPADVNKFKIAYGETPSGFTNEVMTFEKEKILSASGVYSWYIDKLPEKTYYFKILGVKSDGTLVESVGSEAIMASIGKGSCVIGNV